MTSRVGQAVRSRRAHPGLQPNFHRIQRVLGEHLRDAARRARKGGRGEAEGRLAHLCAVFGVHAASRMQRSESYFTAKIDEKLQIDILWSGRGQG